MSEIQTVEQLDEMRARALVRSSYYGRGVGTELSIVAYEAKHWADYLPDARLIRMTDHDAGLVTVPRAVTPEMALAHQFCEWPDGHETADAATAAEEWGAMLSASPFVEPPQ